MKFSVDPADSAKDSFVRPIVNAQLISVPLPTVDLLAAELHLPRVDFIKTDIEGAETRALKGAKHHRATSSAHGDLHLPRERRRNQSPASRERDVLRV